MPERIKRGHLTGGVSMMHERRPQYGVALVALRCSGAGPELPADLPIVRMENYRAGLVTFCPRRAVGEHNPYYRYEECEIRWISHSYPSIWVEEVKMWSSDHIV